MCELCAFDGHHRGKAQAGPSCCPSPGGPGALQPQPGGGAAPCVPDGAPSPPHPGGSGKVCAGVVVGASRESRATAPLPSRGHPADVGTGPCHSLRVRFLPHHAGEQDCGERSRSGVRRCCPFSSPNKPPSGADLHGNTTLRTDNPPEAAARAPERPRGPASCSMATQHPIPVLLRDPSGALRCLLTSQARGVGRAWIRPSGTCTFRHHLQRGGSVRKPHADQGPQH